MEMLNYGASANNDCTLDFVLFCFYQTVEIPCFFSDLRFIVALF